MTGPRPATPTRKWAAIGGLGLALGPLVALGCAGPGHRTRNDWDDVQATPIRILQSPQLDEIALLEDLRTTGNGRLQEFLRDGQSGTRLRAAVALGRLPYPLFGQKVTIALVVALDDSSAQVRAASAFGLGLRGDPASIQALLEHMDDPDVTVRARIVEAAGRFEDDPELHRALLAAFEDPAVQVRIELAEAAGLWSITLPNAHDVDTALHDALTPADGLQVEPELRWRVLYALQRRRSEVGREAFEAFASGSEPLDRLFAVRGLGRIEQRDRTIELLTVALQDPDARIAYEAAVGLEQSAARYDLLRVAAGVEHPSPQVRAATLETLGGYAERDEILPYLWRGTRDVSASVRSAALLTLAEVLPTQDALAVLLEFATDDDPVVRAGAAEGLGPIADPKALEALRMLVSDPSRYVAGGAVAALGVRDPDEVRPLLHELLAGPDNGLRLGAVLALRDMAARSDVPYLAAALEDSQGDIASEIAFNAVENLGRIRGPEAEIVVREALDYPDRYVVQVATEVLRDEFQVSGIAIPASSPGPSNRPAHLELPKPRWRYNPIVEIQTTRGRMVFELFPEEAPTHVHNFIELAYADYYDGLTFHRVVPDFVVQGGDYRGDGNGSRPWRGRALRHEIGPRKYVRGSLGMPRNQDPDSGGSQFFVTQRPTPHLDGRYTVMGELRRGFDVLGRLEIGDRILDVRIKPEPIN